jgi:hypothetical protein
MAFKIEWAKEASERAKSGHALFGPSTLPRVFRCRRSTRFVLENRFPNKQTAAAQEGSDCHALAQRAFEYDREASVMEGCDFQYMHHGAVRVFQPTEEQCRIVQEYLDWCNELPGDHFVETRVELSHRIPLNDQFGSTDHGAIYARTLVVTDLKAGYSPVYAKENEQALAYALGLYDEWSDMYDIDEIVIRIAQPRLNNWDVWKCSTKWLLEWAGRLHTVIEEAMSDDAKITPGEKQCEFCPAAGQCTAQLAMVKAKVEGDFDAFDSDQEAVHVLSIEDLGKAYESFGFIDKWKRSVMKRIYESCLRGEDEHGCKIVESKSRRTYKDLKIVEQFFHQQKLDESKMYAARKLNGPATMEKLFKGDVKKKFLADFVTTPPGKPVLASVTDDRPLYDPGEDTDFDGFEVESNESNEGED